MIIFPAIDVLGGKVVRLRQGRYDDVTVYNDDPVDQARRFIEAGAEWIHVVDLEGARSGVPAAVKIVRDIAALGVGVDFGGGVRTMETIDRLFDAGAGRVVLGTVLIKDPALAEAACARYRGIVAGIDARDGMVAVEGWREGTGMHVLELVRELERLDLRAIAYTDISRDGMQTGVNAVAYEALAAQTAIPVVASGGVSTLADIRALAAVRPALDGVIVGRAIYEGAFTLEEALAVAAEEAARAAEGGTSEGEVSGERIAPPTRGGSGPFICS